MSKILKTIVLGVGFSLGTMAAANTAPPGNIYFPEIAVDVASHMFDYSQFELIGACVWLSWSWTGPNVETTPELDEYIPDLAVSVYNETGDDPWWEVNETIDKVGYAGGSAVAQAAFGFALGNGQDTATNDSSQQGLNQRTKYVDVIGNVDPMAYFPFLSLQLNTQSFEPYYLSEIDLPGRLGVAEDIDPESYDPLGYYIGQSFVNKWGYEYPRIMTSNTDNDYTASVMAAQRAADIVTNGNALHVVNSTSDSCGTNCAVANVIEENSDNNELWEEVYPNDEHISPGQNAATLPPGQILGGTDEQAGNGNYVFVIWRHYKGCIQGDGDLIYDTVGVSPTNKR